MEKCTYWFLLVSLLLQILPTKSSLGTQNQSGFSNSKLQDAYTALQIWKSAITDDPFGILNTWVGPNVCSYSGVFCAAEPTDESNMNSQSGLVVAGIDLNQANLQGSLVKELSLLSHISLIHLNSNRFTGSIPDTFKDFISLSELDLSNNQFSGLFPLVTLLLPQLIFLDLRFNNFSGTIPAQIFNMNLLDAIFINDNQFEGQIPQNLGNSRASLINLANNKLSGNIPSSFGYMGSSLKEVLFLNNQLTGCIPQRTGLLSELKVLDVSFNSLMGSLPKSISCLNQIEVLNVANNKLSGFLSDQICSLKSLLTLVVSNNLFSGVSSECNKLIPRNLGLDLRLNCIIGLGSRKPRSSIELYHRSRQSEASIRVFSDTRSWSELLEHTFTQFTDLRFTRQKAISSSTPVLVQLFYVFTCNCFYIV